MRFAKLQFFAWRRGFLQNYLYNFQKEKPSKTMSVHQLPIPAPTQSVDFEYLCLDLFRRYWEDSSAQLYGVPGQNQCGIDIIGRPSGGAEVHAVQCKVRVGVPGKLLYSEIQVEVAKADQMPTPLHHLIIATTARRDASLQAKVLALTQSRVSSGRFPVTVMGWDDITALLAKHVDVARHYFPKFFVQEFPPPAAEGAQPKKGGSERSARLRKFLTLMNEGNERDKLTISEIAEQLNLEKITHLEDYLSGTDEPTMELLKEVARLFFVNLEWLLHGKGEPFYHENPFFPEALDALDMIRSSEPERIFFVRCNSPEGGALIVLQYGERQYLHLNTYCHVSAHVGGTGRAQLLSLFRLIEELVKPGLRFQCMGQTLEPAEFDKLLNGKIFPGSILDKPHTSSPWWDALLDLECRHSSRQQYSKWYGQSLVDAQDIIKEQKTKV